MTPIEYYEFACQENIKVEDAEQRNVLAKLQLIYNHLLQAANAPAWRHWFRKVTPVKGLYIYGGVGIGKTFLMDCFYNALPFKEKRRQHFHVFMRFVHQALKQHAGIKNPLDKIAEEMSRETRVLCFDEFVVTDITDAMLLRHLLSALFSRGVCVVATSNVAPDDLYKRGLQRDQFIPAIELIKKFTEVLHLPSQVDYRLRHLKQAGVFYTPHDVHAEQQMEKTFFVITAGHEINHEPIIICDRPIQVKKSAGDIVWFDFNVICRVPRSQQDYLMIAITC